MPQFDLTAEQLREFRPDIPEPDDFDEFWRRTLAEARAFDLDVQVVRIDTPYSAIDSYDLTFSGFGGDRIHAWLHTPRDAVGPLDGVVEYIGYGGGRGLAHSRVMFALSGYAHLVMDNRGMGFGGMVGHTPDLHPDPGGSHAPGNMTKGIASPETYYFRRLITDAVRAVEAMRANSIVELRAIAVAGGSMGGGLSCIATSLSDGLVGSLIDVPFLCHFDRAIRITDRYPYSEIVQYLHRNRDAVEVVQRTLSYFDAAIHARRASTPAQFSVALMDDVCPPSTVYAAYNAYGGDKTIIEYEFNNHEGGQEHQELRGLTWLADRFSSSDGSR